MDMDEELNKLKMRNWNFMSIVNGYDFRRAKDRQRFMRKLGERQLGAVFGGAGRSTANVVTNFMTKVYKMLEEEERFFVHVQDWVCVSLDCPACSRAGISDHGASTTTPIDHE